MTDILDAAKKTQNPSETPRDTTIKDSVLKSVTLEKTSPLPTNTQDRNRKRNNYILVTIFFLFFILPIGMYYIAQQRKHITNVLKNEKNISDATTSPNTNQPAGQCQRIKIYKDGRIVDPMTLQPGNQVTIAIASESGTTKARTRLNGAAWFETLTTNSQGEFVFPIMTLPSNITRFTIEAEIFKDGAWL